MLSKAPIARPLGSLGRFCRPFLPARDFTPTVTAAEYAAKHKAPGRPLDVLFFGTSEFAVPILHTLSKARDECQPGSEYPLIGNLEVVVPAKRTQSKSGQNVPVADAAAALRLPIHHVTKGTNFRMEGWELPPGSFDIGVTASFGHMIPPRIIDQFPLGMINAHGSLLPLLKGAAPVQYALLHGLAETGVTTTTLHPTSIDSGRVLRASRYVIPPAATYPDLIRELSALGAADTLAVLSSWDATLARSREQGEIIAEQGPPPAHLARAPKIPHDIGRLNFGTATATEVGRLWRAVAGYRPLSSQLGAKRVLLAGVRVVLESDEAAAGAGAEAAPGAGIDAAETLETAKRAVDTLPPGALIYDWASKDMLVRCKSGVVAVKEFQYECKPVTSAHKFAIGLGILKGTKQEKFSTDI